MRRHITNSSALKFTQIHFENHLFAKFRQPLKYENPARVIGLVLIFVVFTLRLQAQRAQPGIHPNALDIATHTCAHSKQSAHQHSIRHKTAGVFSGAGRMFDLQAVNLRFDVQPDTAYIAGSASYTVVMREATSTLTLDCGQALSVDINSSNLCCLTHENDVVSVELTPPPALGDTVTFALQFEGNPEEQGFGTFVADTFRTGEPVLWTLSQPYGAREWWPTKQSLDDKIAHTTVQLVHPPNTRAIANGVRTLVDTTSTPWTTTWEHHYPIPAYLIAIAVGPYAEIVRQQPMADGGTMPITHFFNPIDSLAEANLYNQQVEMFRYFEDWFGPYPYREEQYGNVWTTRSGGMEHTTMSHVGVWSMPLFAHELAHQWFGNLVTNNSWQHIWLHEGFAVYATELMYRKLAPEWHPRYLKLEERSLQRGGRSGSIFARDTSSASATFSAQLRYRKPGLLLRELEYNIGFDTLMQVFRAFLHDPALEFGYAATADFQRHLEQTTGQDWTNWFDQWIYGYGLPTYELAYKQNDHQLQLTLKQTNSDSLNGNFIAQTLPVRILGRNRHGGIQQRDLRLQIDAPEAAFAIDWEGRVDSIQIDPEYWVITGQNRILNQSDTQWHPNIRPNPTTGLLTFDRLQGDESPIALRVMDATGKIVMTGRLPEGASSVQLSALSPGCIRLSSPMRKAGRRRKPLH